MRKVQEVLPVLDNIINVLIVLLRARRKLCFAIRLWIRCLRKPSLDAQCLEQREHWKLVLFSFNIDLLTSAFWICRALLDNETLTRSVVSTLVLLPLSDLAPVGNSFDFVFLPFLWSNLMSFTTQPNSAQQGMRLGMRCCSMRMTCPILSDLCLNEHWFWSTSHGSKFQVLVMRSTWFEVWSKEEFRSYWYEISVNHKPKKRNI